MGSSKLWHHQLFVLLAAKLFRVLKFFENLSRTELPFKILVSFPFSWAAIFFFLFKSALFFSRNRKGIKEKNWTVIARTRTLQWDTLIRVNKLCLSSIDSSTFSTIRSHPIRYYFMRIPSFATMNSTFRGQN